MKRCPAAMLLIFATWLPAQAPPVNNQPGWVVLSLKDYDQLRARLAPADPEPDGADLGATLTRIDYELRVSAGEPPLPSGRATVTIDVLRDRWVQVPLPAGLLTREARLQPGGQPATLLDGAAVFSKKGRYTLELDLATPILVTNGVERIVLPASQSGTTKASLTLAGSGVGGAGVEVTATGGILSGQVGNTWQAYGNGQLPLTLTWRRKREERREELTLRQRGDLRQWLGLGEDASSVWAEVTLDVLQGVARRVRLQVPPELTVNQVPGANVADWQVKAGELEVTLLEPVDKQTRFLIQGEAKLPRDGAFNLPLLKLLEVERESGGVAVEVLGAAEIKSRTPQGLERAEPADLGAFGTPRQSGVLEAFRYGSGSRARTLKVEVARYTPQAMLTANVEEARVHALMSLDGKTLVRARYAVRNNQRHFLKLTLPAGAALWSAAVEGRSVQPGQGPEASLMLPLIKARGGEEAPVFLVEVSYFVKGGAWAERGSASLLLPALDLPVSRTAVLLFHPPRYRLTVEPGAFRAAEFRAAESPAFLAPSLALSLSGGDSQNGDPNQNQAAAVNSQRLADGFRARRRTQRPAPVPVDVAFPAFGPSLFLAGELTGENQPPQIRFTFQKEKPQKGAR